MKEYRHLPADHSWRRALHRVIFEAETPLGKLFDLGLIATVFLTVIIIILESFKPIKQVYGDYLYAVEWVITICFTVEYILRLICLSKPLKYVFSYYGIVDLLSILPTYLSTIFGVHSLLIIRALRLLRVFRVMKLARFISEADVLATAIRASRSKIIVFMYVVLTIALLMGSLIYYIEGEQNGFTNILVGVYWSVVTMTTVGYGDLVPSTGIGRFLAGCLMILGYAIIAVPTGILSVEIAHATKIKGATRHCRVCSKEGHDLDAAFCRFCGARLD